MVNNLSALHNKIKKEIYLLGYYLIGSNKTHLVMFTDEFTPVQSEGEIREY